MFNVLSIQFYIKKLFLTIEYYYLFVTIRLSVDSSCVPGNKFKHFQKQFQKQQAKQTTSAHEWALYQLTVCFEFQSERK